MTQSYVERELKFDVRPGFEVPGLADLVPPGGRIETSTQHLRSTYYDTAERSLLRARMTLRHRTGTSDRGWQLKVPQEPFREEIRVDATGDDVPEELAHLLAGIAGGRPLGVVATLSTTRSVTALLDAEGYLLAEIDDDTVVATVGPEPATVGSEPTATGTEPTADGTTWREVEVELGAGPASLLSTLGRRLRSGGARRAASGSKLARALGEATGPGLPLDARAGDVVAEYVTAQEQVVLAADLALRRSDLSVIHKARVASRRLRSMLRVFAPLLDEPRAAALDEELRWYAAVLGDVRDRQVLRARLDAMVDELEDTAVMGPVRTRLHTELDRELAEASAAVDEMLGSSRYRDLLAEVGRWAAALPATVDGHRPARTVTKFVTRANGQVSRKLRRANRSQDVHQLHSARKAAKRARYAAEAAEPVIGHKASIRQARRYQKLQDLLGEHQDSLVSADLLRRLGAVAGTAKGENGFAFGVLYERESRNAHRARRQAHKVAARYR